MAADDRHPANQNHPTTSSSSRRSPIPRWVPPAVFVIIGGVPNTAWVGDAIARDAAGYVQTGPDLDRAEWSLPRPPLAMETSRPGVFAVGDARAGSVKRVAAAVGEGSVVVSRVHRFLQSSA